MKRFYGFIIISLLVLVACSNEKFEANEYDNNSYYNNRHTIAETKDGYYMMYNNLITYIDKKNHERYLLSQQKYNLEQLINDENLREESDAYFSDYSEIFYENKKIYIITSRKIYEFNPLR